MDRIKFVLNSRIAILCVAFFLLPLTVLVGNAQASGSSAELEVIDHKIGEGAEAGIGDTVNVHYTGWLYDENAEDKKGRQFDSSHDRKAHFSFMLGAGRVIKGWDHGVRGMKVGGERTLIIPPAMAYGSRGVGKIIPPDSTLIFDVQLVGIQADKPHY